MRKRDLRHRVILLPFARRRSAGACRPARSADRAIDGVEPRGHASAAAASPWQLGLGAGRPALAWPPRDAAPAPPSSRSAASRRVSVAYSVMRHSSIVAADARGLNCKPAQRRLNGQAWRRIPPSSCMGWPTRGARWRLAAPVTLLSAPGAALLRRLRLVARAGRAARAARVPDAACDDILDCADAPGLALAALRIGQRGARARPRRARPSRRVAAIAAARAARC